GPGLAAGRPGVAPEAVEELVAWGEGPRPAGAPALAARPRLCRRAWARRPRQAARGGPAAMAEVVGRRRRHPGRRPAQSRPGEKAELELTAPKNKESPRRTSAESPDPARSRQRSPRPPLLVVVRRSLSLWSIC